MAILYTFCAVIVHHHPFSHSLVQSKSSWEKERKNHTEFDKFTFHSRWMDFNVIMPRDARSVASLLNLIHISIFTETRIENLTVQLFCWIWISREANTDTSIHIRYVRSRNAIVMETANRLVETRQRIPFTCLGLYLCHFERAHITFERFPIWLLQQQRFFLMILQLNCVTFYLEHGKKILISKLELVLNKLIDIDRAFVFRPKLSARTDFQTNRWLLHSFS